MTTSSIRSSAFFSKIQRIANFPKFLHRKLKNHNLSCINSNALEEVDATNLLYNTASEVDSRNSRLSFEKCDDYHMSREISQIYCKDDNKNLYQVAFRTCNVKLILLKNKHRNIPDFDNDKQTQCLNRINYKETCNFVCGSYWITTRTFILVKNRNRRGIVYGLNRIVPLKVYHSDDVLEKNEEIGQKIKFGKSKTFPKLNGHLILNFNDIVFDVVCKVLHTESMKTKVVEPSNTTRQTNYSHATILARYKKDLLQFKFEICQATVLQVVLKKDKSCQVVDSDTYIPYVSDITHRYLHLPLALSTFYYVDPMIKWKTLNIYNALNKINPHWMKDVREKRIAKKKCNDLEATRTSSPYSWNSNVTIETSGLIFKIKGGIIQVKGVNSAIKYEEFVLKHQRDIIARSWAKIRDVPNTENRIPDWNLEMHGL